MIKIMRRLSIILPYFLIFLIFFLPAVDTDLGWHLRYGEHFLGTGQIMRTNELTFLLPGYQWQYGNLYQILTAVVYRTGGLLGLALAYGVLGALVWLVFDLLTKKARPLNLLVFLGAVWLGWGVLKLGWRGQVFTVLGVLGMIWVLREIEEQGRRLSNFLLLPVLVALWANFHGGFVLGLFLIGVWVLNEAARRKFKDAGRAALILGVSALAALVNPFGLNIYREAIKHARYPLDQLIAEWVAPPWQVQLLVIAIALITVGLVVSAKNSKRKIFWIISILVFAYLAVSARRGLPLFGLVVGLALLNIVCQPFSAWLSNIKPPRLDVLWPMGLAVGILVVVIIRVPTTVAVSTQWDKYCTAAQVRYPCGAVEWLQKNLLEVKKRF